MDKQLEKIFKLQKKFDKNFFNHEKATVEERQTRTKEMVLHMISECDELLRTINWKVHRKAGVQIIPSNILEELTDIFKYLIGLYIAWGFKPKDLVKEFYEKSKVVAQRYKQELKLSISEKVVIVDIDGVLAAYPKGFLAFARKNFGVNWQSQSDVRKCFTKSSLLHMKIKDAYRQSGEKRKIPVVAGARELLSYLKSEGYLIILLTSRPYNKYRRIFSDTIYFLKKNKLKYDGVFYATKKSEFIVKEFEKISFAIEDDLCFANEIAELNYKVFAVKTSFKQELKPHKNVIVVKDLFEIIKKLKEENKKIYKS